MKKAVFGIVRTEDQAQRIVDHLQNAGFEEISVLIPSSKKGFQKGLPSDDVSVDVMTQKRGSLGLEKTSKGPEGGATGAVAGGIIGGTIGLLAGIGTLAIPGIGPFIAAGPILAALSGSAIGGSLGLFVGYLVGLGIPEFEAKKFEKSLKEGNCLICVHAANSNEIEQAKNLLVRDGAKDICTTTEKTKAR